MEYANETTEVEATCALCGTTHCAIVGSAYLARYRAGEYVQVAFPECSLDVREIIMGTRTGMYLCPACFPDDEDEG